MNCGFAMLSMVISTVSQSLVMTNVGRNERLEKPDGGPKSGCGRRNNLIPPTVEVGQRPIAPPLSPSQPEALRTLASWMVLVVYLSQTLPQHVRVDLCRRDIGVP